MAWQDDGAGDGAVDFSGWRKPRMILAYSDNAKPRPLRWLWPGQIPFGALTFFDDDDKGWIHSPAINLIARATNGDSMPGGSLGIDGNVLILGRESGPAGNLDDEKDGDDQDDESRNEIVAALDAAGVDRNRTVVMPGVPMWDEELQKWLPVNCYLPGGASRLESAVREFECTLLVVDHMGRYLDDMLWDPTYQEALTMLAPVALLAGQLGLVVLILRCPESMFPAPRRGWGSGDIPRRTVPRIRWVGNPRYTEYERIIAASGFGWYERERLDIWLRNELSAGPVPMKELEWLAADEGWTPKQLRAAKARLRVLAHRHGFGANGYSLWSLPWK